MKKCLISLLICLAFIPYLATADQNYIETTYLNVMLENMSLARSSQNPSTWLDILENELKMGKLTYQELNSSVQEFENLRRVSCLYEPHNLLNEIRKTLVPLALLQSLDNVLLRCQLSYSKAKIDPSELYKHEQRGYISLAIQSKNRWEASKIDIHWYQYQRYIRQGKLTQEMVDDFKRSSWFPKP